MDTRDAFTPAEHRVIEQLLQGKINKEIALTLRVSERTVEAHLGHIYQKLGVSSRTEAVLKLRETPHRPLSTALGESTIEIHDQFDYKDNKNISKRIQYRSAGFYGAAFFIAVLVLVLLLRKQPTFKFEREAEYPDEHTVGQTLDRSTASDKRVHGQFGTVPSWPAQSGSVTYKFINVPETEHLYLKLRYSKHSVSSVPILIFVDDESTPRASILPEDQASWNKFTWTEPIDLGALNSGVHSITFFTAGQEYGVADLDQFVLTTAPP